MLSCMGSEGADWPDSDSHRYGLAMQCHACNMQCTTGMGVACMAVWHAAPWIDTPLERGHTPDEDTVLMAWHLPFGIGKPIDIAKGALFLASADAGYITGTTLRIDGGFSVAQRIPPLHEPIICARQPAVHQV